MAITGVQPLKTGIGQGEAQVFDNLNLDSFYNRQQRADQLEEGKKARAAKDAEDQQAKLIKDAEKNLQAYDLLPKHRTYLDKKATEIRDIIYQDPNKINSPEVKQMLFDYAKYGKAMATEKKEADKVYNATRAGEFMGKEDYLKTVIPDNDPSSPDYNPSLDSTSDTYDPNADLENMVGKRAAIEKVDRVDYTKLIPDYASSLATKTTENPTADGSIMTKQTEDKVKNDGWEAYKQSSDFLKATKNLIYDKQAKTPEEAEVIQRKVYDNSFDTIIKQTRDKAEKERDFKYNSGSGTAENKNWSLKLYPDEVDIQKIAPSGYNEVMAVEVEDKNGRPYKVEGTPVKYVKAKNDKWTALVAVPIKDAAGKEIGTQFLETTDAGYGAVTTKVGLDPYALQEGLGGYKTRTTAATSKLPEQKAPKLTQGQWDSKWKSLKKGEKLTGLDGKTYIKN